MAMGPDEFFQHAVAAQADAEVAVDAAERLVRRNRRRRQGHLGRAGGQGSRDAPRRP
jgi:hypothetical protein